MQKFRQATPTVQPTFILECRLRIVENLNLNLPASIKMTPNWVEQKLAGQDWFRGFLKRHSALYIRKPEPTSISDPHIGFKPAQHQHVFRLL